MDLDQDSRRALDLDELLELLAGRARTAPGAVAVRELEPQCDADRVRSELAAVEQVRLHLRNQGRLIPGGIPDPAPALRGLGVAGLRLDAEILRDLALVAQAAAELRSRLLAAPAVSSARLREMGERIPDLRAEARLVLRSVEPGGTLTDDASRELGRIRSARARVGGRLRRMLDAHLREPQAGAVIRDEFITQRNGRYVIPVRTDAPRQVRGIVHASSSSGATQFVEPLESVELNNELVQLAERDEAEVQRLLLEWTEAFRLRTEELGEAVRGIARADSLQARALFAEEVEAVAPVIDVDAPPAFSAVRHALLDRRLAAEGTASVPLDLPFEPQSRVLLLSGPNAGGKTVALKTIGLSILMAQSGIPVPAVEMRIPVYRQVRADIGDHQSIQADLSTFSAHVRAVVRFLEAAAPPALFLFDEIGTGTEPTEGAALAQSVLEALCKPGMTTIATTHLGALKAWALATDGAASAAMEFDEETLRPTFRVLPGAAGASAGLQIASRFGMDPEIVERARAYLGPAGDRSETYVTRLRELTVEMESRSAEQRRLNDELIRERERFREQAEEDRRSRASAASAALDAALREFRARMNRELEAVRDRREREKAKREQSRLERSLSLERGHRIAELAPGHEEADAEGWSEAGELRAGTHVRVRSLGREGEVVTVRGDRVEVRLGRVPFTVDRSDLRVRAGATPAPVPAPDERPPSRWVREAAPEPPGELMLVGRTVEEATQELDKYLDAAVVGGLTEVRIVHGHGTGRLRRAVRKFVAGHVHVGSHRPGRTGEGGDGATVVRLRE